VGARSDRPAGPTREGDVLVELNGIASPRCARPGDGSSWITGSIPFLGFRPGHIAESLPTKEGGGPRCGSPQRSA